MRIVLVSLLAIFLLFLFAQIWTIVGKNRDLAKDIKEIEENLTNAKTENENLEADLRFYSNPDNLEKESRARFNYRSPGEKMIIIVPKD